MAIHYIVGNPGSGKSYYGVYILYDKFIRTKKTNFFLALPSKKSKSSMILDIPILMSLILILVIRYAN